MKKSITLVALAFGVTSAFAQDLTSKKGEPFLPEAGDWSIAVDANPFLNYMGNFFGKTGGNPFGGPVTGNTAPTFDHYSLNQTITGKYFKDANTAYRATIRLGMDNNKFKNAVAEHVNPAAASTEAMAEAAEQKVDIGRVSTRNIVLGIGMEKRRGKTRLQGVYGADLLVWGGSTKEKYKYANALTQTPNDPATPGFNENLDANNATYSTNFDLLNGAAATNVTGTGAADGAIAGFSNVDDARVLKRKTNGVIGVGVRAFIGVEYFIVPKISIGGEFGWGIGYQVMTKDKATWDAEGTATTGTTQTGAEIKSKDDVNGGSMFVIDTDRNAINSPTYNLMGGSGNIRLSFHF